MWWTKQTNTGKKLDSNHKPYAQVERKNLPAYKAEEQLQVVISGTQPNQEVKRAVIEYSPKYSKTIDEK